MQSEIPDSIKELLSLGLMKPNDFPWIGGELLRLNSTDFYYLLDGGFWIRGSGHITDNIMGKEEHFFKEYYDKVSFKYIFENAPIEIQKELIYFLDLLD